MIKSLSKFILGDYHLSYCVLLACAFASFTSFDSLANNLQVKTSIRVIAEKWPPMHFLDEQQQAAGALFEVTKAALSSQGLTFEYLEYPFSRALRVVKTQPNVLMLSVGRRPDRESHYQWIAPIYRDRSYIIALKSRTDIQISQVSELKNYVLGTVRGYAEGKLRRHGFVIDHNLVLVNEGNKVWELLFTNKVDIMISTENLASYEAIQAGKNPALVKGVIPFSDGLNPMYAITSLQTDPNVADKLRKGFAFVRQSGQYDTVMQKWNVSTQSLANNSP